MTEKHNSTAVLSAEDIKRKEFYWANKYSTENFGIGVQCVSCKQYRLTYEWSQEKDVPEDFKCSMIFIDGKRGDCNLPSDLKEDSDKFSEGQFVPGDVVLAKIGGYPRWPAMITDDVTQSENHFMYRKKEKLVYHVQFFDDRKSTRAVACEKQVKPFKSEEEITCKKKKYVKRLKKSQELAKESLNIPIEGRVLWMLNNVKYNDQLSIKKENEVVQSVTDVSSASSVFSQDFSNESIGDLPCTIPFEDNNLEDANSSMESENWFSEVKTPEKDLQCAVPFEDNNLEDANSSMELENGFSEVKTPENGIDEKNKLIEEKFILTIKEQMDFETTPKLKMYRYCRMNP